MSANRLLPHDEIAERAVIGAAIQDANLAPELCLEWFCDLSRQQAAGALQTLASEWKPIDEAILTQRLAAEGMREANALVDACMKECHSPANFAYWRDILIEKLTLRRIIQTAQCAAKEAYQCDRDPSRKPSDLLDAVERDVLAIRQRLDCDDYDEANIRETLRELTAEYEQVTTEGKPRGLTTGFYDFDKIICGLKPQQFIPIGARPSVGKTSLALNIAEHLTLDLHIPVGFFSLEMSAKELLHRLACSRARVDGSRLNEGRADDRDKKALNLVHSQRPNRPIPTLASNVLAFVCKGFVGVRGQSFTGFFTCFAAR